MQSRPMFGSFGDWCSATIRHKLLRKSCEPDYLLELGRLKHARHIPKRIQKYFDQMTRELKGMDFVESFHATVAALGPFSTATLGMSRKDGEVHFFATQIVTQVERQIEDECYFGFISWRREAGSFWSLSPHRVPNPRSEVQRVTVNSDKPREVLRKHRERIRGEQPKVVRPIDYFESYHREHAKQVKDWTQRGVIRVATPAEVTRVRNQIDV
ncbi:MAG: hypothetical protein AAGI63_03155 [Planctomycetota bacterium]